MPALLIGFAVLALLAVSELSELPFAKRKAAARQPRRPAALERGRLRR